MQQAYHLYMLIKEKICFRIFVEYYKWFDKILIAFKVKMREEKWEKITKRKKKWESGGGSPDLSGFF